MPRLLTITVSCFLFALNACGGASKTTAAGDDFSPELNVLFENVMASQKGLDPSKLMALRLDQIAGILPQKTSTGRLSIGGFSFPSASDFAELNSKILRETGKTMPTMAVAMKRAGVSQADLRISSKGQLRDGLKALQSAFSVISAQGTPALALVDTSDDPYQPAKSKNIDEEVVEASKMLGNGNLPTVSGESTVGAQPYCDPKNTNSNIGACQSMIQGRVDSMKKSGPNLEFGNCVRAATAIRQPKVAPVDTNGNVQHTNMTPDNLADYYVGTCTAAFWVATHPKKK
ncbi:MAG: hypothetical protein NTY08_10695 [Proteobacteria bacterium]|nr:hypothetical protein [Pseudomonadota bacterium]